MRGQENIQKQIGLKLNDGLIKSLYRNGEIAVLINTSFLKFDSEWIQIVCTDEETSVYVEKGDPMRFNLLGSEFEFRIQSIGQIFPVFNKFINKRLLGVKELVLKKSEFMSFGLNLYFEGNLNLIIR